MARTRQTVLVVDDDSATRDGLAVLLESWGYQVALAADGKAALKLCEEELPHAIVTDLMMPGMNGLEFVEARGEGNFLALKCAAISPTLMERELFGHEKGAFTSAVARPLGCFEQADGGTPLLDEITEMALEIQPKFLRVLEEGQVRRIGGNKNLPVSVRVVAATNRQPASAVKDGKLRQALFYRLNVFHLDLPPLRERGEDITLLAVYFLETFAPKYQRPALPWGADLAAPLQG